MTSKLVEWLTILIPTFIVWFAFSKRILLDQGITSIVNEPLVNQLLVTSPFILLLLFGIYAVITVLYRTFTFNDCPEAAKELQKEIQEAKKFLAEKGIIDAE